MGVNWNETARKQLAAYAIRRKYLVRQSRYKSHRDAHADWYIYFGAFVGLTLTLFIGFLALFYYGNNITLHEVANNIWMDGNPVYQIECFIDDNQDVKCEATEQQEYRMQLKTY